LYVFFISPQVGTVQSAWLLCYGLDNEEKWIQFLAEADISPFSIVKRGSPRLLPPGIQKTQEASTYFHLLLY
jgi:hypothetical protein